MRTVATMRPQAPAFLDSAFLDGISTGWPDGGQPVSWHISRLLPLPPGPAQAACDALRAAAVLLSEAGGDGSRAGSWVLPVPRGRLVLHGGGRVVGGGPLDPYRRWFGHLAADGSRRPVAVEVQLMGWSSTRCELGMRPATRSGLVGGRRGRLFFDAGNAALDAMVAAVHRLARHGTVLLVEPAGMSA